LIAGFLLLVVGSPSEAALVLTPSSLSPGTPYRLAFVTSGVRDASSSNIADYNAFVTAAANSVAELADLGVSWYAIASTGDVDARVNTLTIPSSDPDNPAGVPIFLLSGLKLADHYNDLWNSSVDVRFNISELGTNLGDVPVWTGTTTNGTARFEPGPGSVALGANSVAGTGSTDEVNQDWIHDSTFPSSFQAHFYAVSSVLTVPDPPPAVAAPEPPALLVWVVIAGAGAVVVRKSRGRGRAPESEQDV
jgi:hypothetical protein